MVKKTSLIRIAAVAAVMASILATLFSCTSETPETPVICGPEGKAYTFELSGDVDTKTSVGQNGTVAWEEGDLIWYFTDDGDNNMKAARVYMKNGRPAVDIRAAYNDEYVIAVSGSYWVGDAWRKGFNMWNVAWKEQDGTFNSARTGYAAKKLSDYEDNGKLHFTNVTSIISFTTTDKRTRLVRFRSNDGTPFCTEEPVEAWVNPETLTITKTQFYDSKESCIEIAIEGAGRYYAGVIPCTLEKGFTIECVNEKGDVFRTMTHNGTLKFKRSVITDLGRLEDHYPPEIPINKITLTPTSINDAATGLNYQIEYTYTPENATLYDITWTSSNTTVATVEQDGTVTAQGPGTCTITASAEGGAKATCSVKVLENPKTVEKLALDASTITILNGKQYQFKTYILPKEMSNAVLNWTSSDESVATVSSKGLVTAKKAGTTMITASNLRYFDCRVNVTTTQVSNKDLSAGGTANCYIAPYPGTYKFKATVKGNSTDSVGTPVRAEVLWETLNNNLTISDDVGYRVKPGDVITDVNYSGGYVTFRVPAPMRNGNALIAVKNSNGTILWSWHIWVCYGYEPGGTRLMDRDLGAVSGDYSTKSAELLGMMYQWGRKDPFVGLGTAAAYYPNEYGNYMYDFRAHISTQWPATVAADATHGTMEYATANPMTFIRYATFGQNQRDWMVTETGMSDLTRWGRTKTKYDPCPPGWRVCNKFGDGYIENGFDYTKNGVTDLTNVLGQNTKFALGGWIITTNGNTSKYHLSGEWQYKKVWSCDPQIPDPNNPQFDINGDTYRGAYELYIAIGIAGPGQGTVFFGNNCFFDHGAAVRCQRDN